MSMLFRWCEFSSECNSYLLVYNVDISVAQVPMLREKAVQCKCIQTLIQ